MADVPMTVKAMKAGAIEFLTKPFRDQDLLDAVQVALDRAHVTHQTEQSAAQLRASSRRSHRASRRSWPGSPEVF